MHKILDFKSKKSFSKILEFTNLINLALDL